MNQIVITWEQMNTCIMDWGNKRLMEYICLRLPIKEKGIERLELTDFCLTKTKSRVFEPAFFDLGGVVENIRTKFVRLALNKDLFIPDLKKSLDLYLIHNVTHYKLTIDFNYNCDSIEKE